MTVAPLRPDQAAVCQQDVVPGACGFDGGVHAGATGTNHQDIRVQMYMFGCTHFALLRSPPEISNRWRAVKLNNCTVGCEMLSF